MTTDFLDTYAIRTGRTWTAVRVGRGQCTVARADGNGRIVYQGQDQRTIKRAANEEHHCSLTVAMDKITIQDRRYL